MNSTLEAKLDHLRQKISDDCLRRSIVATARSSVNLYSYRRRRPRVGLWKGEEGNVAASASTIENVCRWKQVATKICNQLTIFLSRLSLHYAEPATSTETP